MRLFVAINFSATTQARLVELQDELRARCVKGSFSHLENLHLTLAFLGEVAPDRLASVQAALAGITFQPFELTIERVGCGRALWWAGVAPSQPLMTLQRAIARELRASDIDFDQRAYKPHITLAREVIGDVAPWQFAPFGEQVSGFDLMLSQRLDGRLTYTPVQHL